VVAGAAVVVVSGGAVVVVTGAAVVVVVAGATVVVVAGAAVVVVVGGGGAAVVVVAAGGATLWRSAVRVVTKKGNVKPVAGLAAGDGAATTAGGGGAARAGAGVGVAVGVEVGGEVEVGATGAAGEAPVVAATVVVGAGKAPAAPEWTVKRSVFVGAGSLTPASKARLEPCWRTGRDASAATPRTTTATTTARKAVPRR
jgi:hypothetical protein